MDESVSLRRKSVNKRRVNVLLSEDEDDQDRTPFSPPQKRTRYSRSPIEPEEDILIDVDDDRSEGLLSPSRSFTPPQQQKSSSKKRESYPSSTRSRESKKRWADDSGDEFDVGVVSDDLGRGIRDEPDDDEEFVDDVPKKGKGKSTAKAKGAKGGKGTKNPRVKGKGQSQEKEITVRDERQGVASSSMKIRIKPSVNVDAVPVTNPGMGSVAPDAEKGDGPIPQKKRKLPSIKKNKTAASGTPTTISKPTASMNASSKTITADGVPSTPAARASAGSQGGDFNLQDRNVYEMLFKSTGGSNARAGSLRENEERRKYLNSLREADKAKRALDAKQMFDLQAQMDKISAFEDRLRLANSCVLYPNILGAKMREAFEQGRRRREPQGEGGNNAMNLSM
ncbi:hypothetical protein C8J55DRAFT_523914 [Lentinula edodes]|uniref:Uncharacterized protein n=1 Tax=Lentinula lateritia TaxID=40482 RepID=A0A9W8ZX69_9AGAR|nr:hypothetical protein C8J55DRAFT_523914 [Lentinula edodes]